MVSPTELILHMEKQAGRGGCKGSHPSKAHRTATENRGASSSTETLLRCLGYEKLSDKDEER